MAQTVPAMKARLGEMDYFILSMKAQELVDKVKIPKEMKGWGMMSLEERYQRDINYNRVKSQIAPYFANDKQRFFGAVILAAMNFGEEVSFEPLSDVTTKGLPGLYRTVASNMGFLTFNGGEVLVPLDGQHRLAAIQFAVTGRDNKGKDLPDITPCTQLSQEDVTVILVSYEPKSARKIFTRVNRYARPTTAGQNYVTDDDDIIAVLAREVANQQISARLVKYKSNTLTNKDPEFTTLGIIYRCNEEILKHEFGSDRIETTQLPDDNKVRAYRRKVRSVWDLLLEKINVFKDCCSDTSEKSDQDRIEIRKNNLLGKPVSQECLVRAYLRLRGAPTNMSPEDACNGLNSIAWGINEKNLKKWDNVLWTGGIGGKILTKKRELATRLISYSVGEKMTSDQEEELLSDYLKQFPDEDRKGKKLPDLKR